jgi:hypothetical protein
VHLSLLLGAHLLLLISAFSKIINEFKVTIIAENDMLIVVKHINIAIVGPICFITNRTTIIIAIESIFIMRNARDPESFPKRCFQTDVDADMAEPR